LPEALVSQPEHAEVDWWQAQYRAAVVTLRATRCDLGNARRLHQQAVARKEALTAEVKQLKGQLRLRNQQLFGRRSEKRKDGGRKRATPQAASASSRPRGQQPGHAGHGRRDHSHLPAVEETHSLPADQQCCPSCRQPFAPFPGTEDSEEVHVEVKAHRRIIRRSRYKRLCQCATTPAILAAPGPAKLIPKGKVGLSVWVHLLLGKYLYGQPVHRLLTHLDHQGLHLPPGTITDGLQRIEPLLLPPYEALLERQRPEGHWHADETGWRVFERIEGKANYQWVLWVVHSASAVVFLLKPSRAGQVLKDHLGEDAQGFLSVDRYSAYKGLAKETKLELSWCWAHVRRDFIHLARAEPEHEAWALEWVDAIGHLYHLNAQRLDAQTDDVLYPQAQAILQAVVDARAQLLDAQLTQPIATATKEGVLKSLKRHWDGLTLFVDYPFLPIDNNTSERALRGPVVGRKNYYGSGCQWSGRLAASMFSLTQTLLMYRLNPHLWLTAYLQACAQAGGVPKTVEAFLPWNLSEAQRQAWALADAANDTS
jgi:transposase